MKCLKLLSTMQPVQDQICRYMLTRFEDWLIWNCTDIDTDIAVAVSRFKQNCLCKRNKAVCLIHNNMKVVLQNIQHRQFPHSY